MTSEPYIVTRFFHLQGCPQRQVNAWPSGSHLFYLKARPAWILNLDFPNLAVLRVFWQGSELLDPTLKIFADTGITQGSVGKVPGSGLISDVEGLSRAETWGLGFKNRELTAWD